MAAIAAGVVALRFGSAPRDGLVVLAVLGCAVLSALVDLRCHRLPDAITAPLWAAAWPVMVAVAVVDGNAIRIRFALVAGVVALLVLGVGWLMGMGLGDVKLGALLALVSGWLASEASEALMAALAVVFVAAVGAVLHSVLRCAGCWFGRLRSGSHRARPSTAAAAEHRWFAFGPHLVAGATVVIMALGPTMAH
jgi:prepilin signal peptidase PulO-like enzyme (type II secretory pathway)